jgi:hypothetical protein
MTHQLCCDIDIMPTHSTRQPPCGEATNMAPTYHGNDTSFEFQSWGDGGVWDNVSIAEAGFATYQADGLAHLVVRLFSNRRRKPQYRIRKRR